MIGNWKKALARTLLLGSTVLLITGCGNNGDSSTAQGDSNDTEIEGNVKLWIDTEYMDVYKELVKDFEDEYPDVQVEVAAGNSTDAQQDVSKDPNAAADVFMMPHDQIGQMAQAGLLYPNTKYADEVKENNVDSAIEAVTWEDKIYGYPYGVESNILYYNQESLAESDVESWDTLTEKGKLGANFAEDGANYDFAPLFMSNGLELYGKNGDDPDGTNFNNDKGIEVLKWIANQKQNSGVIQSGDEALSNLEIGKTDALLSGPWSKGDVENALGDKMGVTAFPTVDFGNGEVQMKAFLGVRVLGVNQQTETPLASMALANYLSSQNSQLALFEGTGNAPSNQVLQDNEKVKDDPVAKAVTEMSDEEHSVVMPKIPEIVSFFPPMDALINDTYKGKIKEDNYQEKLDKLVDDTKQAPEEDNE